MPEGRPTVLLSADVVGSAEVLARLAGGNKKVQEVDLAPGLTVAVRLPEGATLVQVTPAGGAAARCRRQPRPAERRWSACTTWSAPGSCRTSGPRCRDTALAPLGRVPPSMRPGCRASQDVDACDTAMANR